MQYRTVFDAAGHPLANWSFPAFGLIFVAIGAVMLFRPQALEVLGGGFRNISKRRFFSWSFFLFSVAWVLLVGITTFSGSIEASQVASAGTCKTVAGLVANFHPAPYTGHDMESFTVNGVPFSYSDYVVTPGFRQSASHGGPIHEGLPVRICYADGAILRLQVPR